MKIHEKTAKRFLFLDDDFEKNIEDLFEILYLIFNYPHKHYTFKHFEV